MSEDPRDMIIVKLIDQKLFRIRLGIRNSLGLPAPSTGEEVPGCQLLYKHPCMRLNFCRQSRSHSNQVSEILAASIVVHQTLSLPLRIQQCSRVLV